MSQNRTDEELMRDFQAGESAAFDELFRRHRNRVYGFLLTKLRNQTEAEDMVQEVFVKIIRFQDRYHFPQPLLPWIFVITQNVFLDGKRKAGREARHMEAFAAIPGQEQSPSPSIAPDVSQLDRTSQSVIKMRVEDELDFSAIARELGGTAAWARQVYHRAIKKLRGGQ